MRSLNLIAAEDSPREREYLASVLHECKICFATDGLEALGLELSLADGLITDIQMPGLDGIGLARRIWHDHPDLKILFWTQHNDEIYLREIAKSAPSQAIYGYTLKENHSQLLRKAVDSVFNDEQRWVDTSLRPANARKIDGEREITDYEMEVLVDIALGLTDNTIAKRRYLSRRGVQNRLASLYQKLGLITLHSPAACGESLNIRARAINVALQRGLINAFELKREEEKFQRWLKQATQFN